MAVSVEAVKTEIGRYWAAFTNKDAAALSEFYAHTSLGFSSTSKRTEPGRMAAVRREREYFNNDGKIEASVGNIEVLLLSDSVAVAAYTFQFRATRKSAVGKPIEETIDFGRATQVFALDPDGHLRIFHEHFSEPVS